MWRTVPQQQNRQQEATRPPLIGIDYGGPNTGIVHANRLVLAGSEVVPDLVMASHVGFRPDDATDADVDFRTQTTSEEGDIRITDAHGFWFRQTSPRQNTFHAMLQQEGLFFFGDLGEATIPPGPFSATQVVMRENSWYGSDIGRTVLIVGGQVIFVQTGGRDIRGLDWNETQRKYVAISLIATAGAVFSTALDVTYVPSAGREGETVFVIDDRGDAAVAVIAADQPWPAWTRWTTGPATHRILAATSPRGRTTFLVDRDGVVALETLDETQEADVVLDAEGAVASSQPFDRVLETLPFVARSQTGSKRSVRKSRIMDLAVDYDGEYPDGVTARVRTTGRAREKVKVDTGKPDRSNLRRVRYGGRRGWSDRSRVEMTFSQHVRIAGLSYKAAG